MGDKAERTNREGQANLASVKGGRRSTQVIMYHNLLLGSSRF